MSTNTTVTATTAKPTIPQGAVRTAAWAALALFLASFGSFTPERPANDATGEEIRRVAEQNTTTLAVNAVSALLSAVALLVLVSALTAIIRSSRPGGVAATYVSAAGTITATQILVFPAFSSVWVLQPMSDLSDEAVLAMHHVGLVADMFGSLCLAVTCSMVGVVSWLALRDRWLSRPLALFGLVVAAGEVVALLRIAVPGDTLAPATYLALFGWFLWPALVGLDLMVRALRSAQSRRRAPSSERVRLASERVRLAQTGNTSE